MEHHERPILQENADDGQIGKKKRKRTMKMDNHHGCHSLKCCSYSFSNCEICYSRSAGPTTTPLTMLKVPTQQTNYYANAYCCC
ncbi:hypothetical protein L3Y34_012463 [Caenorhabditis briggsae]|uniref:Uncharacterized protein n=1 Tax=Caenorhabditis briggsae TaxID=6238 RepID=A0AAE8ZU52_CAEBR|nr:hypothetical protein L3Y34_012463 [Caenorhabditis briggsae]